MKKYWHQLTHLLMQIFLVMVHMDLSIMVFSEIRSDTEVAHFYA
jgi:hypothetical protein